MCPRHPTPRGSTLKRTQNVLPRKPRRRIQFNFSQGAPGGGRCFLLRDSGGQRSLPLEAPLASKVSKYFPRIGCQNGTPLRTTWPRASSHFYLLFRDHLPPPNQPNRPTCYPPHTPAHLAFLPACPPGLSSRREEGDSLRNYSNTSRISVHFPFVPVFLHLTLRCSSEPDQIHCPSILSSKPPPP